MRWRLLAVYLMLQAALGILALHFVLPTPTATEQVCDEVTDVQTGERRTECFTFPPGNGGNPFDLTGPAAWVIVTTMLSLLVLAPIVVLELVGVSRHHRGPPRLVAILAVALLLIPLLVNWENAANVRLVAFSTAAGALLLFAFSRWRTIPAPPTMPPNTDAPSSPSPAEVGTAPNP